jgi:archaellum biogenesis protein FlaJ (TadC family)
MNKYITLFGSLVLLLIFIVTLPVTLNNPVGSNLWVSLALGSGSMLGIYMFFKPDKNKKKESKEEFTPID